MTEKNRKILFSILLIFSSIYITHSIHLSNYREYTRSETGENISYPNDQHLTVFEKLSAQVGVIFFVAITILFVVIFYLGVGAFYKKYKLKTKVSEKIFYILSVWLIAIFVYSLATSQFGISFLLELFFGKGIHYLNK